MTEETRITPDNPLHYHLLERYRRDNGIVYLNGKYWMPIQDNDALIFVQTNNQSSFGDTYEQSSFKVNG